MMFLEILVLFALAAVLLASVFKKQVTAVKSGDGGVPLVNKFSVEEMDADLLGVLKSCKEVSKTKIRTAWNWRIGFKKFRAGDSLVALASSICFQLFMLCWGVLSCGTVPRAPVPVSGVWQAYCTE